MNLSLEQRQKFDRDGFIILRGLFTTQEVSLAEQIGRADQKLVKSGAMKDAQGGESKIWLAMELREDIYNALVRSPRIVKPIEQLLGGPIYLWHYKMIMKEPKVGGAWEWHQDYGYWYNDCCLYPNLISCMIGINRANQGKRLPASAARFTPHGADRPWAGGRQQGADVDRVAEAAKTLDLVYVELEAGDALIFHCNLLHRSAQNHSDHPRWAFISCYNAMSNIPYKGGHGKPVKLDTWDDEKLLSIGEKQLAAMASATTAGT